MSSQIIQLVVRSQKSQAKDFWNAWFDAHASPGCSSIHEVGHLDYISLDKAVISSDFSYSRFAISGTDTFTQNMMSFFDDVKAPYCEIERFQDLENAVNPDRTGSYFSFSLFLPLFLSYNWTGTWMTISSSGRMSSGWEFPVTVPLKLALEAFDGLNSHISSWVEKNEISTCDSIARDMGSESGAEIKFNLTNIGRLGDDIGFKRQVGAAFDAVQHLGFSEVPEEHKQILEAFGEV